MKLSTLSLSVAVLSLAFVATPRAHAINGTNPRPTISTTTDINGTCPRPQTTATSLPGWVDAVLQILHLG